jgi:hypothetical protein
MFKCSNIYQEKPSTVDCFSQTGVLNLCDWTSLVCVAGTGCLERKFNMMELRNGNEVGFPVPVLLN